MEVTNISKAIRISLAAEVFERITAKHRHGMIPQMIIADSLQAHRRGPLTCTPEQIHHLATCAHRCSSAAVRAAVHQSTERASKRFDVETCVRHRHRDSVLRIDPEQPPRLSCALDRRIRALQNLDNALPVLARRNRQHRLTTYQSLTYKRGDARAECFV